MMVFNAENTLKEETKRKTITVDQLQTIIEVMQDYDNIGIAQETNEKLFKLPYLREHVEKQIPPVNLEISPFGNEDFKNEGSLLIIKDLIIQLEGSEELNIESECAIDFIRLDFEPKRVTLSDVFRIKFKSGINVNFLKSEFESTDLEMQLNQGKWEPTIDISGCKFFSINFRIYTSAGADSLSSEITLSNNTFANQLCISDEPPAEQEANDYAAPLNLKRIQRYSINLINNDIHLLKISHDHLSYCWLACDSGNRINQFGISGELPRIASWGFKEKIIMGDDKEAIDTNRATFMDLRKKASDDGNRLHEVLFQHHITECDEALINLEPNESSWQEKTIMFAGRVTSNHGTSWLRPALILTGVNLLITLMLAPRFSLSFGDSFYLFLELFQPFKTINEILNDFYWIQQYKGWLSFFTLINKLTYAICAYEFIRAARRFTPR